MTRRMTDDEYRAENARHWMEFAEIEHRRVLELEAEAKRLREVLAIHANGLQKCADDNDRLEAENAAMRDVLAGPGAQDLKLVDAYIDIELQVRSLQAENAALRPIVKEVATRRLGGIPRIQFYEQARAFLASEQAAESEGE